MNEERLHKLETYANCAQDLYADFTPSPLDILCLIEEIYKLRRELAARYMIKNVKVKQNRLSL
jgi:hypothetical protein